MGMSAGAFGVGNNCDRVAERVREQQPYVSTIYMVRSQDVATLWEYNKQESGSSNPL